MCQYTHEVHTAEVKPAENSAEESKEDVIECAHCDLNIESCIEYADGDESKNCEDCNTFLCSPCLELTELHQKKQFLKHTKRRCLSCIKKKVADIKRNTNSGSVKNRDELQLGGKN